MIICCLLIVPHIIAQDNAPAQMPAMMAVTDGVLTLYGMSDAPQPIMDIGYLNLISSAWSPNGRFFGFSIYDEATESVQLWATDTQGESLEPLMLADDIGSSPISFTANNIEILFTREIQLPESEPPTVQIDVYTIVVSGEAPARLITSFFQVAGCSGFDESPVPMDSVYQSETGLLGNRLVFAWTTYGMIFSRTCLGIGIDLLNPNSGQSTTLHEALTRVVAIPDTATAYGIITPEDFIGANFLVQVNLETRVVLPINVSTSAEQLAVGDGAIYYATRILQASELSDDQVSALQTRTGLMNLPEFLVEIHRYDINARQDIVIHSEVSWGVTRMIERDGWLYFTSIPTGEPWLTTLMAADIDPSTPDTTDAELASVAPNLYRVPVSGGEVELVMMDISTMAVRPTITGNE